MKKKYRFWLMLTAIVLCAATLCSCTMKGEFSVNKKIVCEVDGEPISFDEYKYFFYGNYRDLGSPELTEENFAKVKSMTEEILRKKAAILKIADDYGVKLTRDQKKGFKDDFELLMDDYESEQAYVDALLEERLTGTVLYDLIYEYTNGYYLSIAELFRMGVCKDISVTDEAIIADVLGGDFYHYKEIVFELTEGKNSLDLEKVANRVYADLKSGDTFDQIANGKADAYVEYRKHCKVVERYAVKGEKIQLIEDAILALGENCMSEVIWSGEGYHIFLRLPIDQAYVNANPDEFFEQHFGKLFDAYVNNVASGIKLQYAVCFDSVTFEALVKKEQL